MINVLIPQNKEFQLYESQIKDLYLKKQEQITDTNSFEFIKENTFFYLFLKDGNVLGAIYFFSENGKLFLNGFSKRKTFSENIYCLKQALSWFECDIYAEVQNRASALCLLRCGFKRVNGNLFKYSK